MIVLYSTGCPKCKELKMMLNKYNIEYTENNSVSEMIRLGFDTVPVLCVNGSNMNFAQAKKWINKTYKEEK